MTCLFRYRSRGVFIHTMWSTCECYRPTYQFVTFTRFENSLESFVRVFKHFYSKCIIIHHSFAGIFLVKGGGLWNWNCAHPIMHVIMHVWARNNPVKHYVSMFPGFFLPVFFQRVYLTNFKKIKRMYIAKPLFQDFPWCSLSPRKRGLFKLHNIYNQNLLKQFVNDWHSTVSNTKPYITKLS